MDTTAPTIRALELKEQQHRADVAELVAALKGIVPILVAVKFTAGLRGNQVDRLNAAKALLAKHGA